jgi:hypothetical protein
MLIGHRLDAKAQDRKAARNQRIAFVGLHHEVSEVKRFDRKQQGTFTKTKEAPPKGRGLPPDGA